MSLKETLEKIIESDKDGAWKIVTTTTPVEKDLKQEPAKRNDAGKIRWDLLPADSLEEVARVFTVGAEKYEPRNWEKGMSWGRCFRAMLSHAWKFWRGERYDTGPGGTGCHHMAMVAWNALVLCSYDFRQVGKDDRVVLSGEAFRPVVIPDEMKSA